MHPLLWAQLQKHPGDPQLEKGPPSSGVKHKQKYTNQTVRDQIYKQSKWNL